MANPAPALPSIGGLSATLVTFLVLFIIYLLVIGFVLWLAGEIVVGRRVTFGEALGIASVGNRDVYNGGRRGDRDNLRPRSRSSGGPLCTAEDTRILD